MQILKSIAFSRKNNCRLKFSKGMDNLFFQGTISPSHPYGTKQIYKLENTYPFKRDRVSLEKTKFYNLSLQQIDWTSVTMKKEYT